MFACLERLFFSKYWLTRFFTVLLNSRLVLLLNVTLSIADILFRFYVNLIQKMPNIMESILYDFLPITPSISEACRKAVHPWQPTHLTNAYCHIVVFLQMIELVEAVIHLCLLLRCQIPGRAAFRAG